MGEFINYPLPAPRAGVNYTDGPDAPAALREDEARELINLYPDGSKVKVRGGLRNFATIAGGSSVRSLYSLPLADGSSRLLSASGFTLNEISTGTPSDVTGTTPTSDDWSSCLFNHHLFLFNGVDTPQKYDGATVSDVDWTGVTASEVVAGGSHKERMWVIEVNSLSAWYADEVQTGTGAAVPFTEYPLAYFFKKGGYLMFVGGYTNQTAQTSDDLIMFASSEGELLFFTGLYPGSAWGLVARYYIGRPMGYNAFVEVDNDTWIVTDGGIYPVSILFSGGPIVSQNSIGRKINPLIQRYAKSIGADHLWDGTYWRQGKRVYIRIPTGGDSSIDAVCNLETGAWTLYQYTNVSAVSRAVMYGIPYVGAADGQVFEAEQNFNDNDSAINYSIKMPFSFLGKRDSWKIFKDVVPLMKAALGTRVSIGIETDFKSTGTLGTIVASSGTYTPWGSDWGSPWSSTIEYQYKPASLRGSGHSGALHIQGSVKDVPLEFSAFEIRYESGEQR